MTLKSTFVFLTCLILSGCWLSRHQIPLPQNPAEFPAPAQKPLKFSEPRKIKWNLVSTDSVHPGRIHSFEVSKLPFQTFNPYGFRALPKAATLNAFNYSSIPDTVLNLEIIPNEPLISNTSLLGNIKKITLGPPGLRAESYHTFFQYGDEQGLPGHAVGATLHTRDGQCWIATSGGICVLNGESMELLPYNYGEIYFFAEDRQGQVWVATPRNGIFIINRKAGYQKQLLNFERVIEVRADTKGFIWITSARDGLFRINPDQKSYKHLSTKNGLSSQTCIRTLEDREGRIWISNFTTGADILDPAIKKIKRLGSALGGKSKAVLNMRESLSGDMFLAGSHRGIDIFNIRKATHAYHDSIPGIQQAETYDMLEDEDRNMWITTDSFGLVVLNKNLDSATMIGVQQGLGEGVSLNLEKDSQHQIYSGTTSGGMNVFPSANRIAHHITKKEGLLDNNVWGLLEDSSKRLWIGTYAGVNILTPDQKLYKLQVKDPDFPNERVDAILQTGPGKFVLSGPSSGLSLIDESRHTLEKIGTKEGLPTKNVRGLYLDSQGLIWVETTDAGLIIFDPEKRTIRYLNKAGGLASNQVTGVQEISSGIFWISSMGGGIERLDLKENTVASYSMKEGLSNDLAISVFRDNKNRFWVPTEKGLNLLDPGSGTNTIFSISNGMPSNGVYTIYEKKGRIFAGTGKGLTVLEETENYVSGKKESSWSLQTYGRSLGLPYLDFNANAIALTRSGQFWWGIVPGISVISESALKPDSSKRPVQINGIDILGRSQYFMDPGLIRNIDTIWSDSRDTFYLPGSFSKINSDRQKGIVWDSLSSINIPEGLSLPYNLNYLRFHFGNSLPQYVGDYQYQYILDGVDEKWNPVTDLTVTDNYNNISPGHYTFRVAVKKGPGPWSEPAIYHFRIRPPWWFSWWTELIYFFIFLGLVRLWVGYRSRRLIKENAMLEQKVNERTEALRTSLENLRQTQSQLIQAEKMASLGELTAGIAHEIQNPLNFVNNFSEVNTELLEDAGKALEEGDIPETKGLLKDIELNMGKITFHGKRADAIVKGMLLHSRASSGQKTPTDVNNLADEYLRLSYHGLRAKDKSFNAQFVMEFDEKTGEVMLVQQDIGRVLLNLFNNAFYSVTEKKKRIPEGYQPTVTVTTKRKKDSVEIRIRDNGQGIPKKVVDKIYQPFFTTKPAGQGTGLGLSLSYDIITKEHGGKIDVITKENEFTEFIVELPFITAA